MKKTTILIFIIFLIPCVYFLAFGFCIHKWEAPTCEAPKTCSSCGKTEGEALGHAWVESTCELPKTCSTCFKTEGNVQEHMYTLKLVNDEYLRSKASVYSPAEYYYACKYCHKKGTTTYQIGNRAKSTWKYGYYVDDNGATTNAWLVTHNKEIKGKFSNARTTDATLSAKIYYDQSTYASNDGIDRITIFLYEYGNKDNQVKNIWINASQYYEISIENDLGEKTIVRGQIYPGEDRIKIEVDDTSVVLKMMKTSKIMEFYIQSEHSPETNYRFDVDVTDFLYMYEKMVGKG